MAREPRMTQRAPKSADLCGLSTQRGQVRFPMVGSVVACVVGAFLLADLLFMDRSPARDDDRTTIVRGDEGVGTLSLAVSPVGALIATTDTAGRVSLRGEALGWHIDEHVDYKGYAMSVAFSPDGRFLAIGGHESTIVLPARGQEGEQHIERLPLARVNAIAFSSDGRYLGAASTVNHQVVVWDRSERRQALVLESRTPIVSLAFSPDGRALAAGEQGDGASVYVWDLETGRARFVLNGSWGPVVSVAFSPDGDTLASAAIYEKSVRVWDTSTGRLLRVITGDTFGMNSISFSPDGRTLASAGNDGLVRLWSVLTGEQRMKLNGQSFLLNHVAFSPDGQHLFATGYADNDLRVWECFQPENGSGPSASGSRGAAEISLDPPEGSGDRRAERLVLDHELAGVTAAGRWFGRGARRCTGDFGPQAPSHRIAHQLLVHGVEQAPRACGRWPDGRADRGPARGPSRRRRSCRRPSGSATRDEHDQGRKGACAVRRRQRKSRHRA